MTTMLRCRKRGHPMIPQNQTTRGACRSCHAAVTYRSKNPDSEVDVTALADEFFARYSNTNPGEPLHEYLGRVVREEWRFMKPFLGTERAITRLADAYKITPDDVYRKVRGIAA